MPPAAAALAPYAPELPCGLYESETDAQLTIFSVTDTRVPLEPSMAAASPKAGEPPAGAPALPAAA